MKKEKNSVGPIIRDIRLSKGMTGAELARRAGITRQYLNDIELRKSTITAQKAASIANVLGIDELPLVELALNDLLTRQGFIYPQVTLSSTTAYVCQ